jgi:large subunit ribosomal protein L6
MSRIGKAPVKIKEGVEVNIAENVVTVKGAKGELTQEMRPLITAKVDEGEVILERANESKEAKSLHGLYRALIQNMVEGVTDGYVIKQELVGVGFRAKTSGQQLELALGYSHPIVMQLPPEIKITTETVKGQNPTITLESHDKQLIGQVAAKIRSLRVPEPYKGKGIRYSQERIRRKAGKAASK